VALITIGPASLDVELIAGARAGRPPLVFLHEGLGSLALWRDFPARVAAATGCAALVYSRSGYGKSSPLAGPRPVDYMHREALGVLPALLAETGLAEPLLIGHSDGASIALIYAGTHEARGVVAMAPHVFVEDISIASIAAAREAWMTTDLRQRLARYHDDVEGAFKGWNDAWLDPAFRDWNIEEFLPRIRCPVLAIQGADDEYGTLAQLDAIERQAGVLVERLVLPGVKHSPWREQPEPVLRTIVDFVERLL
jgi:pimeloyl-ACP methyl ester carboxylesterase